MSLLAACLLCTAPQSDASARAADVAAALAALRAGASVERASAEQRLAVALTAADVGAVRGALAGADAEVAARLVNAIGARDEHVELAARLLVLDEPLARDVGARALRQQIERWLHGAFAEPRRGKAATDALSDWRMRFDWRPIAVEARASANPSEELDLERELDRLARLAPLPVGIALDPDLALAPNPRARAVEPTFGAWDVALDALRRAARFELQTPEQWPEWGEPTRPFAVVLAGSSAAPRAPGERLVEWLAEVASTAPAPRRAACARALAGSSWPAGIEWLGRRWSERGDAAALDGALLAAGRGAVARALRSPEVVRTLLELVDQGTDSAGANAQLAAVFAGADAEERWQLAARIGRALGAGPAQNDDGSSRVAELAAGLDGAHARGAFARLVALELLGGAHPDAAQACARLLAQDAVRADVPLQSPQRTARVLRQALRATVALGGAAVEIAHPELLLACATDAASARELARLLEASAATAATRASGAAPAAALGPHAQLVMFAWHLARGRSREAAALLATVDVAEAGAWARAAELERGNGAAPRVAQAARDALPADTAALSDEERSRELESRERIREFEFHAGILLPEAEPLVVDRAIRNGNLELLARAVAGPAGEAARAALVDVLRVRLADEAAGDDDAGRRIERALGAALRELYAARLDEAADAFDAEVGERLRAARKHPLAKALLERGWPRLPPVDWIDLEAADRAP
ncbi:MAG: hypothetical protein EPO68_08030 [Planctomycetota bacterium]|nr:MAG: hypothetical protein EPO68_08030 [Planctomycetota bacterium]